MKPTYQELEKQLEAAKAELAEARAKQQTLESLLQQALTRLKQLEERLGKNSKNSSKPPSTDQKANTSGRANGAHRECLPESEVDHVVKTELDRCPHCGSSDLRTVTGGHVLQQVELPEVRGVVTQYECAKHRCRCCGTQSFAKLPEGVPDSAFGPRLMGLFAWCTGNLCISKRDAIALIQGIYQIKLSEGSAINIEERVANALQTVYEGIHHHVMQSFEAKTWTRHVGAMVAAVGMSG